MWSASIRVVDDDGNPVSGAGVSIHISSPWSHDTQYTDDDGWAHFEYDSFDSGKRVIVDDVYINGTHVSDDFILEDGDTKSFTLP